MIPVGALEHEVSARCLGPVRELEHEVPAGARGDATVFEREGYAVARGAFAPEMVRAVRAPLIDALLTDGHIERVEDDEDRFRWVGNQETFDRAGYYLTIPGSALEQMLRSGVVGRVIEAVWGRRPAISQQIWLFLAFPGDQARMHPDFAGMHRDLYQVQSFGEPDQHVRLWCPLTRLGADDGALGVAVGSHRIANRPGDAPPAFPGLYQEIPSGGNDNLPPHEQLAPLWCTTHFEVGDVVLFHPDVVHSAAPNHGSCLRLSLVLTAQDACVPLSATAGLSLDPTRDLADIEWLTLAIMTLQLTSLWRARCAFSPRGIIGQMWTEQPNDRVARAFTTLEARGLIELHATTHADGERYFHATPRGRSEAIKWLTTPGSNDQRLLELKLRFCDWLDLGSGA